MKIRKINTDSKGISVGIFVPVGSAYETEDERGLAHFIEHMLFKGTKNRTYKQIAEQVDELGGSINAFTSKECTCFYINVLKDYINEGFDILSDLVYNPLIDAKELDKEKGVIIEEINMTEDSPDDAVYEIFFKNCFGFRVNRIFCTSITSNFLFSSFSILKCKSKWSESFSKKTILCSSFFTFISNSLSSNT